MPMTVVTGAPGAGKTAILKALEPSIPHVPEPARIVLAEERASGGNGTPDQDPELFVKRLLERSIESHRDALRAGVPVLFDRGVPDCAAYARLLGVDPAKSIEAASTYRYRRVVLVAKPWRGIYVMDDERKMSFEATLRFQELIEQAYEDAGYELVEIPRGDLANRVDFVTSFVGSARL